MIKTITVTNYLGESIKLDLARPELSGFAVLGITGLGPGKANINTTEIATIDGGLFNSSKLPIRNIVIALKFLWKDSIEDVRQRSYKYFPIKKKITLAIETDNRNVEIAGYVETNDPTIFSSAEGTSISIVCPDPNFYSAGEGGVNTTIFSGVEPMFEFPFSNDSLTDNLLDMASIERNAEKVITYRGDSEIGVTITIHAIGDVSNIAIYNLSTREIMHVNVDLINGDDIVICTVKGQKSAKLIRNGDYTNILNCLDKNPCWFQLSKGDNIFAYTAEMGYNNVLFKVENRIIFEGV